MRIWVDVYDTAGNRLGAGPVTSVIDASITRALDGAGSFTFSFPAADERALDLCTNEREVQIWSQDAAGKRLLGRGLIRWRNLTWSGSQRAIQVKGNDLLDELKRKNTLLGRIYDQDRLDDSIDDLIGLVSGWTASTEAGVAATLIQEEFDGVNVLKACQKVVEHQGLHLRADGRVLEVGAFGTASGLRVFNAARVTPGLTANPNVLLVDRLTVGDDTYELANWLMPLGGGDPPLTLANSTRSSPYTIQSLVGPDSTTQYYISDSTSISTYGEIRKRWDFPDIKELSATPPDPVNAANALYDAAVAELQWRKDIQRSYSFSVKNVKVSIEPGDTIRVHYKGRIYDKAGAAVDIVNENDDFYVMTVTEGVSASSSSVGLEIAKVARREKGLLGQMVDAIDATRVSS